MPETATASLEADPSQAPLRAVPWVAPAVAAERRADGSWILRSAVALPAWPRSILAYLEGWAVRRPEATFLAQRRPEGGWRPLSYGAAWSGARAIGQALIDRGLGPDRPVMILSGNSIGHALVTLGAMLVGVPVAPVSPAYSLLSRDFAKLRHCARLVAPGLVYVEATAPFAGALAALDLAEPERDGVELVAALPGDGATGPGDGATALADLLATPAGDAVDAAYAATGPDTVAKILFTSGSTGEPKGVINTQRMLSSNQAMHAALHPVDPEERHVLVDWLPWHHTYGGNAVMNAVLRYGATLYIDEGKPVPGLFEKTVETLSEVSPTSYSSVPVAFQWLADRMDGDLRLRDNFFRDLRRANYGGANLPEPVWRRIQAHAVAATGRRILFGSGYGATETAPTCTLAHWPVEGTGNIGVPVPGAELKLVPVAADGAGDAAGRAPGDATADPVAGDRAAEDRAAADPATGDRAAGDRAGRFELRVRGLCVTPGYHRRPDLTAAAFDEEGFYRLGDAVRFVDPSDPSAGLRFDGRVVEDFKLTSGTWIAVGTLRTQAIAAAAPLVQDVVVCAPDRPFLALLAWPAVAALRRLVGDAAGTVPVDALVADPRVRSAVADGLARHNAGHGAGSSHRIRRCLLLVEPPSIDAGEITDKGYVNQRAALARRAAAVEALYAEHPPAAVIEV